MRLGVRNMEIKKERIVIIGPAYPYRGGIAAFSERLAREYIAMGAQVSLVTFTLQYPGFLFPGKTQYSCDPAPEGLEISRLINSCNPFSWIRAGKAIRKMNPSRIIFAFWMPFMGPAFGTIARIARKGGARTTGLLHNLIPHEHKPGDKIFTKYFCKAMDSFVTMSDAVLEDTRRLCPDKVSEMSPHPLYDHFGESVSREEAIAHLGLDPGCRYLLFFGLIRDYKGLDLLLDAFADPRLEAHDNVRLIVAGEFYSDPQKYLDAVAKLSERVILRPVFIPDSEVRYYFCAADLVVQPYKSATQSGITQIAYHFEKPMLVTRVGGLPEIVPDGIAGMVVEADRYAIADALTEYVSNPRDYSEGVISQKQKYSWEKMVLCIEKN